MASVSGTNNSYTSLSSQIRGYGGLASGLDRDTMIEQMTAGTRSKIAKQGQQKTKLEWQQTAMRDITSKIYNFTSSYTSYSSNNNLLSSSLFSRNHVTAAGENSKYISVSGTAASADNMSISRIKQLASNASLTTGKVSSGSLQTGAMKLGEEGKLSEKDTVSTIVGDAFYIKYGQQIHAVKLQDSDEFDYTTADGAIKAIKKALEGVEVGSGTNAQTLGDIIDVGLDKSGKIKFTVDESKTYGNTVKLNGGTGNILEDLGILMPGQNFSELSDEEKTITSDGLVGKVNLHITEQKTLAERLGGAQVSFKYNGEAKWITLEEYKDTDDITTVRDDLQKKLDEAFGKGRIKVTADEKDGSFTGQLSFETIKPDGTSDASSTLSISSGTGIVGKNGVFGIMAGSSNRLNLSANLENAGFKSADKFKADEDGNYKLVINGKTVEGITKDSTIKDIIDKINSTEGIGVSVSYQEMSDRFVVTSTENGASGDIVFDDEEGNIAKYLFGDRTLKDGGDGVPASDYRAGQDAVLEVQYPGSDEPIEITRGSNTFSLDGLNITLKGTFGYTEKPVFEADGTTPKKDENGNPITELVKNEGVEAITFDAEVDADKTVEAVKGMIDAFNEILELVNTQVKTKPNRDYFPLTDEQKADMTDDQIEKWEEKAKKGILFGDMDLRMMADSLRTVINSGNSVDLSNMGITVSTNYSDNGKLVFDEAKFRTALQKDPDAVKNAFNKAVSKDENGNSTQGGLIVTMKNIMDRYGSMTGATKGILVERAGSIYAPTSVMTNGIQKQLDRIDDYVKQLQKKLETETDRYISQFTSLETLISQMNSQSSYLSSLFA